MEGPRLVQPDQEALSGPAASRPIGAEAPAETVRFMVSTQSPTTGPSAGADIPTRVGYLPIVWSWAPDREQPGPAVRALPGGVEFGASAGRLARGRRSLNGYTG
jgi:hypothetical protein